MFYYALVKFIQESEYTFCALTGSRQVGKSYALLQLTQEFSYKYRICYYNVKQVRSLSQESFVDQILSQINFCDVLIIGELACIQDYPQFLVDLKNEISYYENEPKVILTGSSTTATKSVCMQCLGNGVIYCNASFLDFQEYLQAVSLVQPVLLLQKIIQSVQINL